MHHLLTAGVGDHRLTESVEFVQPPFDDERIVLGIDAQRIPYFKGKMAALQVQDKMVGCLGGTWLRESISLSNAR